MSTNTNSPDGHQIAHRPWVDLLGTLAAIVVLLAACAFWWAITPC